MILFWLRRPLASLIRTKFGRNSGKIIDYESGRFQVVMVLLRVLPPTFYRPKKDYKYNNLN